MVPGNVETAPEISGLAPGAGRNSAGTVQRASTEHVFAPHAQIQRPPPSRYAVAEELVPRPGGGFQQMGGTAIQRGMFTERRAALPEAAAKAEPKPVSSPKPAAASPSAAGAARPAGAGMTAAVGDKK